jgi:hypothetical protein
VTAIAAARVLAGLAGLGLIVVTLDAALRTFVVPRGQQVAFSRAITITVRRLFIAVIRARRLHTHEQRDAVMVRFAPLSLLLLPAAWLGALLTAYAAIYWAVGVGGAERAVAISGSSLLTLGFDEPDVFGTTLVAFSEAGLGVGMLAIVITYLPTIYAAFSRRELLVAMLDGRAGTPPSAVTLIERYHVYSGLDELDAAWVDWERWLVDVGESHTSHPIVPFFRSQLPAHSWTTAAACVLDAANLRTSSIDYPGGGNASAWMLMRGGIAALRRIAAFFGIRLDLAAGEPISIERAEFDAALAALEAADVPLVADRDVAWQRFVERRRQYDRAALELCSLVDAAPAPWSADRAPSLRLPPIVAVRGRPDGRR